MIEKKIRLATHEEVESKISKDLIGVKNGVAGLDENGKIPATQLPSDVGSDMTGATSTENGTHGLVPAPQAGDEKKVLLGDGTWGAIDDKFSFTDHDTATSGTSFTDAEDGNMLVTDWTKNLFNPTLDTTTKNGVTCTNNGDGTYTLDGTASINTYFIISGVIYDKNIINKYEGLKLAGAPSGSSYESFYLYAQFNGGQSTQKIYADYGNGIKLNNIKGYETLEIIIFVRSGKTVSNLTFKPMLTTDLSATYDDFVPYGGYEIQSCGKNLIEPTLGTTTKNGLTCTNNGDGTFTLNTPGGEISSRVSFAIHGNIELPNNARLKFVCIASGVNCDLYISAYSKSNVWVKDYRDTGDGVVFDTDTDNYIYKCILAVQSGTVLDNVLIKPMLTTDLSATYATFEKYQGETITVTNDIESPAFGLKSHKGITNIISPGNVKCVYPTNESGVSVLEKERQLDDNKSDVVIDKSTGNKVVFTIENGIICAREA